MTDTAPIGCPSPEEDPMQAEHDKMAAREAEAARARRKVRSEALHTMFGLSPKPDTTTTT
jgi:hypothetical protein